MTGLGGQVHSTWTGYVVIAAAVILWTALVSCDAGGAGGDHGGHEGPAATDFVASADVPPAPPPPAATGTGSTGTFSEDCGRNQRGIRNADNLITSPGESGGAHHAHDYVGNVSTNAFSTDDSLAAAATTCANGDRSTFFWPVLLVPDESAATAGATADGDNLRVRIPDSVLVEFRGSPVSNVVAMPRFLRVIEGNPHGLTAGGTDTEHVQWSCSGDRGRVTRQYPLCPAGQQVVRIYDFPSCWNGKDLDSRNHHSHLLSPGPTGLCQSGTFPVPQLHVEVAYTVAPGVRYAVDSFPEELRSPISDHAGFVDVMPDALMARVVDCINSGQRCTS